MRTLGFDQDRRGEAERSRFTESRFAERACHGWQALEFLARHGKPSLELTGTTERIDVGHEAASATDGASNPSPPTPPIVNRASPIVCAVALSQIQLFFPAVYISVAKMLQGDYLSFICKIALHIRK